MQNGERSPVTEDWVVGARRRRALKQQNATSTNAQPVMNWWESYERSPARPFGPRAGVGGADPHAALGSAGDRVPVLVVGYIVLLYCRPRRGLAGPGRDDGGRHDPCGGQPAGRAGGVGHRSRVRAAASIPAAWNTRSCRWTSSPRPRARRPPCTATRLASRSRSRRGPQAGASRRRGTPRRCAVWGGPDPARADPRCTSSALRECRPQLQRGFRRPLAGKSPVRGPSRTCRYARPRTNQ